LDADPPAQGVKIARRITAIWLCSNHAALIDRDVATYSIDRLRQMRQAHEAACVETVRRAMQESRFADDLVALGPDVICMGELIAVDASAWSIQVRHFVQGEFATLVSFIDQFHKLPRGDHYVLVNALGDGRVLTKAPSLTRTKTDAW
jgi:hypothetical protein